jgi:hypothetical protein
MVLLHKLSLLTIFLLLLPCVPLDAQAAPPAAGAPPAGADSYTVIYTGRLFGQFRSPEVQRRSDRDCAVKANESTPEADAFLAEKSKVAHKGTTLLVAAGDNFAPFLLSRQLWDDGNKGDKQNPTLDGKERFEYLGTNWVKEAEAPQYYPERRQLLYGNGNIPTDNVGCFLRKMGFDAIVPGMQDFYFGPERLRLLARFLDSAARPGETPTRMLGANLTFVTKSTAPTSAPGGTSPAASPNQGRAAAQAVTFGLPKVVLPWMRSVEVKPGDLGDKVYISEAPAKPPGSQSTASAAQTCAKHILDLNRVSQPDDSEADDLFFAASEKTLLKWDTSYVVCLDRQGAKEPIYKAFTVAPSYFDYPTATSEPSKLPWIERGERGAQRVAVFGVVDSGLAQYVGRLNAVWLGKTDSGSALPTNDKYETDLLISDPAEALKQVLEYCALFDSCQGARKVLLAEMPEQAVFDMLAALRLVRSGVGSVDSHFDVVIAEADPDRGSGNRTILRERRMDDQGEFDDPVVLVPGAHTKEGQFDKLKVRLQSAMVTPSLAGAGGAIEKKIKNHVWIQNDHTILNWFPPPVDAVANGGGPNLQSRLKQVAFASLIKFDAAADWRSTLTTVVLKSMLEVCHADMAMIQRRDVFFPARFFDDYAVRPMSDAGAHALLNAIFWKGDFVQCVNVSGSTINSLLQRSQDLAQQQAYGLTPELARDWTLETLGADSTAPDPSQRLAGGRLLDPRSLYAVALTDFLANGDTGYPALQGAQPPPVQLWSKVKFKSVLDSVGDLLALHSKNEWNRDVDLDGLVRAAANATPLPDKPPPAPANTALQTSTGWFAHLVKTDEAKGQSPLEEIVQQRPLWSLSLYKADASYSLAVHNGTEASLTQRYPGVSAVDLTSPDSSAITFDYLARLVHDSSTWQFYTQSELNYGYRKQRQAAGTYQPSHSADFLYDEVGMARHIPWGKNPTEWKFLAPLALQTQVTPAAIFPQFPCTDTTPGGLPCSVKAAVKARSPRTFYYSVRPGLRYDFSYPKPQDWSQGGGGGGGSSSGSGSSGKGGGGGSGSSGGQAGGSGGGGSQSQTFDSYLEFGYQGGFTEGIKAYQLSYTDAGTKAPGIASCPVYGIEVCQVTVPASSVQFQDPLGGRSHIQDGFYFNFRFDFPLPVKGWEFVLQNRGDHYFGRHGDSAVDTHFRFDVTSSLTIPIHALFNGKLNLAPTYETIFYENKISNNFYVSKNVFVALNYSFDWHRGLAFPRVIGYSNPVPTLPPLPTR